MISLIICSLKFSLERLWRQFVHSMDESKPDNQDYLRRLLLEDTLDIQKIREIGIQDGFGNSEMRRRVYPKLLGVNK